MSSCGKYTNFVRASPEQLSSNEVRPALSRRYISGSDVKRIYLDVVSKPSTTPSVSQPAVKTETKSSIPQNVEIVSDNRLFLAAQNDDHQMLKTFLTAHPQKLNIVDEFGWSLLMIACQANAVNTVKVLLEFNIDKFIRDRAGNSANTLLLKQKNIKLINILLSHKANSTGKVYKRTSNTLGNSAVDLYDCAQCKMCVDKKEHLASTVHNMHLSVGRKVKPSYGIPESNRGYQILVRSGWDRDNGLGPKGSGEKYPIKPVIKQDRKGLGAVKRRHSREIASKEERNLRPHKTDCQRDKLIERNFRREFYDV